MFRPSDEPNHQPRPLGRSRCADRAGFTVLELLIGISIMVMIVGALGALARAVESSGDYSSSCATATEHARVSLERIERTVEEAFANEHFPGFVVLEDEGVGGSYRYPDTLVVWHPDPEILAANPSRTTLTDPARLPYYDELVVFCPDPNAPHRLVEIRSTQAACLSSNPDNWADEVAVFKTSMVDLDTAILNGDDIAEAGYSARTLTNLLRTCAASGGAGSSLGAIRFESRLTPSKAEWENPNLDWSALPWVQGIVSPAIGLRQAWLRIELQLVPPATAGGAMGTNQAIPFFGSAAVYYQMERGRR